MDRVGSFSLFGRSLFLRVDELALNSFHDVALAALGPQEVDPVRLFFIVLEPPVPLLEQGPHEHRIVAFAHVHFVVTQFVLAAQVQKSLLLFFEDLFCSFVCFLAEKGGGFLRVNVGAGDGAAHALDYFFF